MAKCRILFNVSGWLLSILGERIFMYDTLEKRKFALKYALLDFLIIDRWKPTYFMYMDESVNLTINVSCLSGIYFSKKNHYKIRKAVYAIHRKIKDFLNISYYGHSIEFHGNDLLNSIKYAGIKDKHRLEVLNLMVQIVNKYKIRIFRIGYNNAREIKKNMNLKSEKLYGLHMLNFSHLLDVLTRTHKIFLVMDSVNHDVVEEMSRMIYMQTSDTLMYPDRNLAYIIQKPYNILESVVYVDSEYSELMQLSDVIGYLFTKRDYRDQGKQLSSFGEQIGGISDKINPKLIHNRIIEMQITPSKKP
ncbi:MAG TPA: DUF3800 domain-containing protein [Cyclobacteriaceae bacterium]|nr:DUF3800 domain-containing protein [Cyclobacteriaceae bacterium]